MILCFPLFVLKPILFLLDFSLRTIFLLKNTEYHPRKILLPKVAEQSINMNI